jgi:hypothetical protein
MIDIKSVRQNDRIRWYGTWCPVERAITRRGVVHVKITGHAPFALAAGTLVKFKPGMLTN